MRIHADADPKHRLLLLQSGSELIVQSRSYFLLVRFSLVDRNLEVNQDSQDIYTCTKFRLGDGLYCAQCE